MKKNLQVILVASLLVPGVFLSFVAFSAVVAGELWPFWLLVIGVPLMILGYKFANRWDIKLAYPGDD
jgi:membrane protein implicated in regulation of membrane protease activity